MSLLKEHLKRPSVLIQDRRELRLIERLRHCMRVRATSRARIADFDIHTKLQFQSHCVIELPSLRSNFGPERLSP